MNEVTPRLNNDGTQNLAHKGTFMGRFNTIRQVVTESTRTIEVHAQSYSASITWHAPKPKEV